MMTKPVQKSIEEDEEPQQKADAVMQDEAEEEKANAGDAGTEANEAENADEQVQMVDKNPSPAAQKSSFTVTKGATYWNTGLYAKARDGIIPYFTGIMTLMRQQRITK